MSEDYLDTPLHSAEVEIFEAHPEMCPGCDAAISHQEDGAHEFECGAFLVRETGGVIWKLPCPHEAEEAA